MRRHPRHHPTPFDTEFVHLVNLHRHHPQDPHHSTRRHDDLPEAVGIRLGDSRPKVIVAPRKPLYERKRFRNKQQTLVRAAYHGRAEDIVKLFALSTRRQNKLVRKDSRALRRGHGTHRNSTLEELKLRARAMRASVVDVNAADVSTGMSALSWAARRGHADIVTLLLSDYGASVEQRDTTSLRRAPLHHAAQAGCVSIVRALIDHDAPIDGTDSRGNTALILAAQEGHTHAVLALLEAGADPEIANTHMNDALTVARRMHRHAVVDLIEEHLYRVAPGGKGSMTVAGGAGTARGELILHHLAPEHLKTSPVRALLDFHLEREGERREAGEKRYQKRTARHDRVPLGDRAFAMGSPTGFGRSRARAAGRLYRMRDQHDIPGRFERMDLTAQTDRAEHWDALWGRKEGETNVERLERLGERHGKIPGQCPHLFRGQACYSMRELGECEYLHIPERPNVPKLRRRAAKHFGD
jgi:hypothetical protein